jgi:hypothetical protein
MSMLAPARAAASRRNGAQSRGPRTPEGKARSAQNALRHGLRAQKFVVVGDEDPEQFAALEAALIEELAPEGALQTLLAGRMARAAWRLERAERIEAELFAREMQSPFGDGDLGLALIRDGNGARAFNTLLRYRGATLAELWRGLRLLKALQAEARAQEAAPLRPDRGPAAARAPIEPETGRNPGPAGPAPAADDAAPAAQDRGAEAVSPCAPCPRPAVALAPARPHSADPIEPENRANPAKLVLAPGAAAGNADALRLSRTRDRP